MPHCSGCVSKLKPKAFLTFPEMWFLSLQTEFSISLAYVWKDSEGGVAGGHLKELHQVGNHLSVDDLHVVEQKES